MTVLHELAEQQVVRVRVVVDRARAWADTWGRTTRPAAGSTSRACRAWSARSILAFEKKSGRPLRWSSSIRTVIRRSSPYAGRRRGGPSSPTLPSSTSWRTTAAVNVLETDANANAVPGGHRPSCRDVGRPGAPAHARPSSHTIATETPGMPVLRRNSSIAFWRRVGRHPAEVRGRRRASGSAWRPAPRRRGAGAARVRRPSRARRRSAPSVGDGVRRGGSPPARRVGSRSGCDATPDGREPASDEGHRRRSPTPARAPRRAAMRRAAAGTRDRPRRPRRARARSRVRRAVALGGLGSA